MNQNNQTINYDLGHFEGFNFRTESAIERALTAQDIVAWNHDRDGEAEFWPAGNKPELSVVFEGQNCVTASELLALASLLDDLGGDTQENYLSVYFAVAIHGGSLGKLTADQIRDQAPCCFFGTNFTDVRREAAFELFELYYPELYRIWESTPCDGLIFDTDRFLDSPSLTVAEVHLGSEVAVLVSLW
ncbi:MAG TPA: hypothetical protein PLX89_00780 [Verrucomicrobiota bacterium]|nr:hypothetical protein [Verrucomicrobiales bacterium]HRI11512.1 hypothetical protein [Verrucomicrobiota bacterium]